MRGFGGRRRSDHRGVFLSAAVAGMAGIAGAARAEAASGPAAVVAGGSCRILLSSFLFAAMHFRAGPPELHTNGVCWFMPAYVRGEAC